MLLSQKLDKLRTDQIIETRSDEKLRLKQMIFETEAELRDIEYRFTGHKKRYWD